MRTHKPCETELQGVPEEMTACVNLVKSSYVQSTQLFLQHPNSFLFESKRTLTSSTQKRQGLKLLYLMAEVWKSTGFVP